jgi:RNA recognition motif-containing protein
MSKKLYVGNLPYDVTSDQLNEMFSKFGKVNLVDVITDKYTNQSKGFGFVEMEKEKEAGDAIKKLHDSEVDGRKIIVNEARPREERPRYDNRNSNGGYRRSRGKRY